MRTSSREQLEPGISKQAQYCQDTRPQTHKSTLSTRPQPPATPTTPIRPGGRLEKKNTHGGGYGGGYGGGPSVVQSQRINTATVAPAGEGKNRVLGVLGWFEGSGWARSKALRPMWILGGVRREQEHGSHGRWARDEIPSFLTHTTLPWLWAEIVRRPWLA